MAIRGAGVGVAVIDSGITVVACGLSYLGSSSLVRTSNGQRVAAFVNLINGRTAPYDDNGHGTHVVGSLPATASMRWARGLAWHPMRTS